MYKEIELIDKIPCDSVDAKEGKIDLLLLFIEEYGGWIQHLRSVGSNWGASGEESGALRELKKAKAHINELRKKVLELTLQ